MSTKSKLSVSTIPNPMEWTEKCITCPFDKAHRLLPSRLVLHLNRCAPHYSGAKMLRCPFDISHVVIVSQMENHVKSCIYRSSLERLKNPDKIPPTEAPEIAAQMQVIESTEDWDNEPAVPSYDPAAYCAKNPVVRTLYGGSAAARREFRELERKRFHSFRKEFVSGTIFGLNERLN